MFDTAVLGNGVGNINCVEKPELKIHLSSLDIDILLNIFVIFNSCTAQRNNSSEIID